jgi:hypothetical protein
MRSNASGEQRGSIEFQEKMRDRCMVAKRLIAWVLASVCLFVLANWASYFFRSDGFGLLGVQDGIVRVGCPFLIIEPGGFSHREFLSLSAATSNLLLASIAVAFALGIGDLIKTAIGSAKSQ